MRSAARFARVVVATGLLVVLAACAAPRPSLTGPVTATPDRITTSDEPENTRRARVRLELASAYFARGQVVTALDQVKQAIAADPTMGPAFNLRGLIYSNLGDLALADESFRRALALDAEDADSMQNYGWHLCQQARFDEADALFARALQVPRYRDTPRTLMTRGICQARSGKLELAETSLQRAFELEAANPAIAVNLSEVLYRRGAFERARFIMRRVNGLAEVSNAQTLWLAARIENRLGNSQAARAMGEQLTARFPESPEAGAFERRRFDD